MGSLTIGIIEAKDSTDLTVLRDYDVIIDISKREVRTKEGLWIEDGHHREYGLFEGMRDVTFENDLSNRNVEISQQMIHPMYINNKLQYIDKGVGRYDKTKLYDNDPSKTRLNSLSFTYPQDKLDLKYWFRYMNADQKCLIDGGFQNQNIGYDDDLFKNYLDIKSGRIYFPLDICRTTILSRHIHPYNNDICLLHVGDQDSLIYELIQLGYFSVYYSKFIASTLAPVESVKPVQQEGPICREYYVNQSIYNHADCKYFHDLATNGQWIEVSRTDNQQLEWIRAVFKLSNYIAKGTSTILDTDRKRYFSIYKSIADTWVTYISDNVVHINPKPYKISPTAYGDIMSEAGNQTMQYLLNNEQKISEDFSKFIECIEVYSHGTRFIKQCVDVRDPVIVGLSRLKEYNVHAASFNNVPSTYHGYGWKLVFLATNSIDKSRAFSDNYLRGETYQNSENAIIEHRWEAVNNASDCLADNLHKRDYYDFVAQSSYTNRSGWLIPNTWKVPFFLPIENILWQLVDSQKLTLFEQRNKAFVSGTIVKKYHRGEQQLSGAEILWYSDPSNMSEEIYGYGCPNRFAYRTVNVDELDGYCKRFTSQAIYNEMANRGGVLDARSCLVAKTGLTIFYELGIRLISVLCMHRPKEIRNKIFRNPRDRPDYPSYVPLNKNVLDLLSQCKTVKQLAILIIRILYEDNPKVPSIEDANSCFGCLINYDIRCRTLAWEWISLKWLKHIDGTFMDQSLTELCLFRSRIHAFNMFVALYGLLPSSYLASSINKVPIVVATSKGSKILCNGLYIRGQYNVRPSISKVMGLLSYSYSDTDYSDGSHRSEGIKYEIKKLEQLRSSLYLYYQSNFQVKIYDPSVNVLASKELIVKSWSSGFCGRLSEVMHFFFPIKAPEPMSYIIIISDDIMKKDRVIQHITRMYRDIQSSIKGYLYIQIKSKTTPTDAISYNIYSEGWTNVKDLKDKVLGRSIRLIRMEMDLKVANNKDMFIKLKNA
nr:VP2 [Letea virus]